MLAHIENLIKALKKLKEQVVWIWGEDSVRQRKSQAGRAALHMSQKQQGWCGRSAVILGERDQRRGTRGADNGLCRLCAGFHLTGESTAI